MATTWTELEKTSNKVTEFSEVPSDTKYPSEKLVKNTIDKVVEDIAEGNTVVAQATNAGHALTADNATTADSAYRATRANRADNINIDLPDFTVTNEGSEFTVSSSLFGTLVVIALRREAVSVYFSPIYVFENGIARTSYTCYEGDNKMHVYDLEMNVSTSSGLTVFRLGKDGNGYSLKDNNAALDIYFI